MRWGSPGRIQSPPDARPDIAPDRLRALAACARRRHEARFDWLVAAPLALVTFLTRITRITRITRHKPRRNCGLPRVLPLPSSPSRAPRLAAFGAWRYGLRDGCDLWPEAPKTAFKQASYP